VNKRTVQRYMTPTCSGEQSICEESGLGARTSIRKLPQRRWRFAGDNDDLTLEGAWVLELLVAILGAFRAAFRPRASLVVENLALRQQLTVLRRRTKRPQLEALDRAFWVMLSRVWSRWAETLTVVKPETVELSSRHRAERSSRSVGSAASITATRGGPHDRPMSFSPGQAVMTRAMTHL
jgi:hypothetical protein